VSILDHFHAAWLNQSIDFDKAPKSRCLSCGHKLPAHPVELLATPSMIEGWVDLSCVLGSGSGVYHLLLDGTVVYVGKSNVPEMRIRNHIQSGKQFDEVAWFPITGAAAMRDFELADIERLQPFYNKQSTSRTTAKSSKSQKRKDDGVMANAVALLWQSKGGGELRNWIEDEKRSGQSYRKIASRITEVTGHPISHEWVRQTTLAWSEIVK